MVLTHPIKRATVRLRVLRRLPGFPRQCPLPLAGHLPKGTKIGAREEAHLVNTILNQPNRRRVSNRPAESRRQPGGCISLGRVRPYTRRKGPPTLRPQNQVSEGEGRCCDPGWYRAGLPHEHHHMSFFVFFCFFKSHL